MQHKAGEKNNYTEREASNVEKARHKIEMEAAGDDGDGNGSADTDTDPDNERRLRQCNLCKFIGKCLAIFLRFLARHFLLCHNFFASFFLHFIRTYLASFAVHLQFYCVLLAKEG